MITIDAVENIEAASGDKSPAFDDSLIIRIDGASMIESTVALTMFEKLLAALGLIREEKKQRTEQVERALQALYKALAETKSYIEACEHGQARNREREYQLAQLWHSASIPLRVIDKDFAERCFIKASYWMEPDTWDKKRIDETGIAINAVFDATRKLLMR